MLDLLQRTYIAVFRRHPLLGRLALVVVLGEVVQASVNNYALSFYVLEDLQRPGRTLGILVSTFLLAEMLLKLPFGHLSDRYGRRPFVSLGIGATAMTALAICVVPSDVFLGLPALLYIVLLPLRVVDGAGAAALWPAVFAAVPDAVPSRERGVAMSVMNIGYMAGIAIGPALAGMVLLGARAWASEGADSEWATKAPFALVVAAAAAGVVAARSLPAGGPTERSTGEARTSDRAAKGWPGAGLIAVVVTVTLANMFATGTLAPYLAPYVRVISGVAREKIGLLLVLLLVPAGLLGIPIGHLADRWPRRTAVKVALVTAAAGLWGVATARSLGPMMLSGGVVTLGFLLGLPAWLALITDMAPSGQSGRMLGLVATAQGAGAFLGPLVGGILWDVNIRYPFAAAAGALTASAVIALAFVRPPKGGTASPAGESQEGA